MKLEEALPLLRQGREIRRASWSDADRLRADSAGTLWDNFDRRAKLEAGVLADDWEVYEAPLTDAQVADEVAALRTQLVGDDGTRRPSAREVADALTSLARLMRERKK